MLHRYNTYVCTYLIDNYKLAIICITVSYQKLNYYTITGTIMQQYTFICFEIYMEYYYTLHNYKSAKCLQLRAHIYMYICVKCFYYYGAQYK